MDFAGAKPVTIRAATLADLSTLRLLWERLCTERPAAYPTITSEDTLRWTTDLARQLEQQQEGDLRVAILLAEDAGGITLGCLIARVVERLVGTPRHYILGDHLYVVPEARGRWDGIGPALLAAALAQATPLGVTMVELAAMAGDRQWERRGWTPIMTHYAISTETLLKGLTRLKRAS